MKSLGIAYSLVVAAYVAWGVLPIFWSLFSSIDPITVLYQRTLWSALILGLTLLCRGELLRAFRSIFSPRQFCVNCVSTLCLGMNWFLYVWAMKNRELFAASMAYYICPLLTMAGAAVLFKERFSSRQRTAMFFLCAGVALPVVIGGALPMLAFCIAAFWSAYTLTRRFSNVPALQALFVQTLSLAVVLSMLLPVLYGSAALVSATSSDRELVLFVLSGVVTAVPIVMLMEGMKLVPLRAVGMLQYIAPTLTLLTSVFYFGVQVSGQQVMSLALIWTGLVIFFSQELRKAVIVCTHGALISRHLINRGHRGYFRQDRSLMLLLKQTDSPHSR
jgi:chloramphenicol-sensitive protein RarD